MISEGAETNHEINSAHGPQPNDNSEKTLVAGCKLQVAG
jgi:hypothetical protein